MLFYIFLSLKAPLRMPMLHITTPINSYLFSNQLDTYEDFFLSYPSISVKNDSLYFRGTPALLLLDGIPITSLKEVNLFSVEKIEVIAQERTSLYPNSKAIVNIITKKFSIDSANKPPYSKIRLAKNPDQVGFEFGKSAFQVFDFYITGELDSLATWNANIGYRSKFLKLRSYFTDKFMLQGSLFSCINFDLKEGFLSITTNWALKDHRFLFGIENMNAFFIQDYWEAKTLFYVVPAIRYDEHLYPQVSLGYIPHIKTTLFTSFTKTEAIFGIRFFSSSVCFSQNYTLFPNLNLNERTVEAVLVSPSFWGAKGIISFYVKENLEYFPAFIFEYQKAFTPRKMKLYVIGSLGNFLRLELKIVDVKIFYKLNSLHSYGLIWEFWD